MANKVVIDVEARFVDNVTQSAKHAESSVDEVTKAVNDLNKSRAKPGVDADTSKINEKLDNTQKKLDKMNKSKVTTFLEAMDNASKKIEKVLTAAKGIAGKTWTGILKVKDMALSPLKKVKDMLFNIKTLIGAIVAGVAANKFILQPIGVADQYSSAKIGFQTLLGQEQGQKMMDDLDKFAKETPFNTTGVIAASQRMIAMGWNAENIIDDMRTIGDAAAATGKGTEGLDRIVLALSQIRSKGKLSTEELNQLAEAGISAKRYLAEGLGYGSGDKGIMALAKDLEGGKIGSEAAIQAILQGMKEYDGMMNKTANETVSGLKSQIEDAFEINLVRRWGQGLQSGAKKGMGALLELLDKSEEGLAKIGDMLYDIGKTASEWVADKLQHAVKVATALTETDEWKNAGLGGKIKILWDGLVSDPIREWWEGGGQQKTAETANKIGAWIGKTLSNALLGILGATDFLNDGVGDKEGAGIAESFVRGFLDNFDGSAITDAFVKAIQNVWFALPEWAQLLIGGVGVVKGIGAISAIGKGIGAVKGFLGSAATGKGLLGLGSMTAINLGAGNLAGGASLSAGALSALGLGSIAGGVVGGVATFKGANDLWRGYKDDKLTAEQSAAYKQSGTYQVGGTLAGAATGAMLGSIIPGLGTVVGGLIGAGVGGLAGMFEGKKVKQQAAEAITSMEELEKQASTSTEAANELVRRQELIAESISENFGSLTLSMEEIQAVVENITFGSKAEEMNTFTQATKSARGAMSNLEASAQELNKWNWKASIGFEFNDETAEEYMTAVQNYISSAEQAIESQHYTFKAAVDLLLEPDSETKGAILESTNSYFASVQEDLDGLNTELKTQIQLALEDGKIDPESEAKVIADLQSQIAEITNKIASAQAEAKMEALKIKFESGQIDPESFETLQKELQSQVEEATGQYDTALETSITTLKLQLDEGAIDQATYDEQISALTEGYTANVDSLKARAENLQFEIVGDAYEDILGEDAAAKLQSALEKSISEGVQPIDWTQEQAANYLGVPSLEEKSGLAIGSMLSSIAETIPESATAVGDSIADGITPSESAMSTMATETHNMATNLLTSSFAQGTTVSMPLTVNVQPTFTGLPSGFSVQNGAIVNQARGGLWGASHIPGFSNGGMVRGGGQLVRVAEEGDPEMIIPLGSQRRERGLKLWEKAGQMLGVPGFFRGGLTSGGTDEGLRFTAQEATGGDAGGQAVQVDVGGITVEVNVDGSNGENIGEAIKAQAEEIAETVAGVLYEAFNTQFTNTPVRGGA